MPGYQNPYMNPYGFPQVQMPMYQPPQKQVEKLNGKNAAMQYPMGANSSAWILDESGLISWLITTDSAGYKTVTAYDINLHKDAPAPDYGTLENRITRLEEIINGRNTTDSSAVRKEQHHRNDSADKANDGHDQICQRPTGHAEPTRYEQPKPETGTGFNPAVRGRFDEGIPGNSQANGYRSE